MLLAYVDESGNTGEIGEGDFLREGDCCEEEQKEWTSHGRCQAFESPQHGVRKAFRKAGWALATSADGIGSFEGGHLLSWN